MKLARIQRQVDRAVLDDHMLTECLHERDLGDRLLSDGIDVRPPLRAEEDSAEP